MAAFAVVVLAGCGDSAHAQPGRTASAPAATPEYVPAPGVAAAPPSPEDRICARFRSALPRILPALAHDRTAVLLHWDGKMGHWSYIATFTAHDAVFANYLGDAATATGLAGNPGGDPRHAAALLGKVNGYCKYDVGVPMGY